MKTLIAGKPHRIIMSNHEAAEDWVKEDSGQGFLVGDLVIFNDYVSGELIHCTHHNGKELPFEKLLHVSQLQPVTVNSVFTDAEYEELLV